LLDTAKSGDPLMIEGMGRSGVVDAEPPIRVEHGEITEVKVRFVGNVLNA
jgi:hypothetical protein